jgi:hypothetical protein
MTTKLFLKSETIESLLLPFFRGHSAQLSRAGKLPKFYFYATLCHIGAKFCGQLESFAI